MDGDSRILFPAWVLFPVVALMGLGIYFWANSTHERKASSFPEVVADTRPGNPSVYARIDAMSDCAALQAEFDTAAATHDRGEQMSSVAQMLMASADMAAADDRMRAVGCY